MDLRHLRYILASARNGSFSAAASGKTLTAFRQSHPDIEVELVEALFANMLEAG